MTDKRTEMDFDVIIIGAGASGTACAAAASQRGLKTAVLEHCARGLNKVKISGGGRCNFTNLNAEASAYVSQNPKFALSALRQFSQHDFIKMMQDEKIAYYEKTQGQLFCRDSSDAIIKMLQKQAQKAKFFYNMRIGNIEKNGEIFEVTANGETFKAASLVIACGGASYPNIGATEDGYKIAKKFGLKVIPYKPALVPLNLDNETMKKTLALKGIALDAEVRCNKFRIRENILFTHFGLSGPAILQASLYWNKGDTVCINFLPEENAQAFLLKAKEQTPQKKISSVLKTRFPDRFVNFLLEGKDGNIGETSNKALAALAEKTGNWQTVPVGTQGFRLAEVTAGGVDTNEISSQTMEAKKVKGLFFIGEVLDITGRLGGYNLQWAWSSGFTAGKYV